MVKNTHFPSETIVQIVALHGVSHQTKEIMDLKGVSHTSVLVVASVSQLLDVAVHTCHR